MALFKYKKKWKNNPPSFGGSYIHEYKTVQGKDLLQENRKQTP